MAYAERRKKSKARNKHEAPTKHDSQTNASDVTNHDFVNEYRMKELSQKKPQPGLDLDGIR